MVYRTAGTTPVSSARRSATRQHAPTLGDSMIDCADRQCGANPACAHSVTTEICDDGIDNDGDGLIDCDDPDCIGNRASDSIIRTVIDMGGA